MIRYNTQIRKLLMWHLHINGWHNYPKPMLMYRTDGWTTDPKEIEKAIRLDDDMEIKQ